eukprot:Colp12_sorted_trinity150504_noHs@28846
MTMTVHLLCRLTPTRKLLMAAIGNSKVAMCTSTQQQAPLHLAFRTLSTQRPSLAADFPAVIRQWHPHKNTVGPEGVAPYSKKKYWFVCDEGHEWETRLSDRTGKGNGCPTCNHKRASSTNNLLVKHPTVAAEWHPTKNGDLAPEDVAGASCRKVWWQCKEGHEWEAFVYSRTIYMTGCR